MITTTAANRGSTPNTLQSNSNINDALLADLDDIGATDQSEVYKEYKNKTLPVLPSEGFKTDKTDETDYSNVTNDDFIFGVYGEPNPDRPIVVSFKGNPNEVKPSAWYGKDYVKGLSVLPTNHNNYLSCSSFKPLNGQYRRTNAQFEKYNWLLCDDVGTKVKLDRMGLTPSWIIETSEGNYQYGYILAEPLTDALMANRLVDGVIAAGLCDAGANGAAARIGRLPVAVNGKTGFQCKLIQWRPDLRYSLQELVDGLEIELKDKGARPKKTRNCQNDIDADAVHIERPTENPVIEALKAKGLYKSALGDGKHDITCPNVNEHTDRVDGGSTYFEPSETYPLGGYKCFHGHCEGLRISYLLNQLGIERNIAKHLPTIRVIAGEINLIVNRIESELSQTGRHYQRSGCIAIIVTDPKTGSINVQTLSVPALTRVVSTLANWERFDKREKDWVPTDPPERHIRILSDAQNYAHLPYLKGVARQPYLRADGSLVNAAGYDAQTHMFGVFNPYDYNIPKTPTRDDAEKALDKLKSLLSEFDFKYEHNRSAALSAILTAAIRTVLKVAPMIHVDAHSIGSGKSYLCQIISLHATPASSTPHTFPSDDEEMKKLLFAELMTAPAVICFDNIEGDLKPYPSLMTALTEEYVNGRILGQSKTQEASTNALFLSSGNNVQPVRDATRRVITITLDPQFETPATRQFKNNPVDDVTKNRGVYISAALTIIRAWIVASRPITPIKPLNSYSEWSSLCRQPLLWLGLEDPAQCVFDTMAHDPDREYLGEFLRLWFEKYGTYSTSVKTLVDGLYSNPDLRDMVQDIAAERDGTISRRKLGWWLKKHAGRIVDGLRLIADKSVSSNASKWQIENISHESVLSVFSVVEPTLSKFGSDKYLDDDDEF
jgi:hypothetical protein